MNKLSFLAILFALVCVGNASGSINPTDGAVPDAVEDVDGDAMLMEGRVLNEANYPRNTDGMQDCDWDNAFWVKMVTHIWWGATTENDVTITVANTVDGSPYSHTFRGGVTSGYIYEFYLHRHGNGECLTGENARYGDGITVTFSMYHPGGEQDILQVSSLTLHSRNDGVQVASQGGGDFLPSNFNDNCGHPTDGGRRSCVTVKPWWEYSFQHDPSNYWIVTTIDGVDNNGMAGCDPEDSVVVKLKTNNSTGSGSENTIIFHYHKYKYYHTFEPRGDDREHQFCLKAVGGGQMKAKDWDGAFAKIHMTTEEDNGDSLEIAGITMELRQNGTFTQLKGGNFDTSYMGYSSAVTRVCESQGSRDIFPMELHWLSKKGWKYGRDSETICFGPMETNESTE